MSTNNDPKLDVKFTLSQHSFEHKLNVLNSADRACAVIAMQDPDDESTNTAATLPLEIITVVQNPQELRNLAGLFTILAGATMQAADRLDEQNDNTD